MDWIELLSNFSCLFFCIGMVQQQQKDLTLKEKFNFAVSLLLMHQRAVVVTCRNKWGAQALGFSCLGALVMMFLWYLATHDPFMLLWMGLWLLCLAKRRIEAMRLSNEIHSQSDGQTINLGSNERLAKLVYEPILVGILGMIAFWFYQLQGWRPTGLPYFLLSGVFTLPFVESVKQIIWQRKVQGMLDAKREQEALMEEFQNRIGR